MSGAKSQIAAYKLKALEKGEIERDRIFLVGDERNCKEIRVCETDFKLCSTKLRAKIKDQRDTPLRAIINIQNTDPIAFEFIAEFAYLCGQSLTKVNSLEFCLKLAAAAEQFEVKDLCDLCTQLLEERFLSVENVWATFSSNYSIEPIASACLKLLALETKNCIRQPTFLEVSEQAIGKFLDLEEMNIDSELELVNACLQYAKANKNEGAIFQRFCPKLRLLTLDLCDLQGVMLFLPTQKQIFLAAYTNPFLRINQAILANNRILCTPPFERGSRTKILNFIGDDCVQDMKTIFKKANWKRFVQVLTLFKISFAARKCIKIEGFDMFCCLDINEEDFLNGNALESLGEGGGKKYDCNLMGRCTLQINGEDFTREIIFPNELEANSIVHIKHPVIVPEGCRVEFTVGLANFENPFYLRMLPFNDLFKINNRETLEYFISIKPSREKSIHETCIFKKFYFSEA